MDLGKFWSSVISFFSLYAFGAFNIIHALFRFSLEIRYDGFSLLCCVIVLVGCFRQ